MAQSDIATKSLVGGGGTPAAVDAGRRPPGAAAGHLAETAKSRNAGVLDQRGDPMMSEPSSSGGGGGNGNNDNGNSGRTGTGAGAAAAPSGTVFDQPAPAGAGKKMSEVLGEIVWLMSQSPLHKQFFISDLEWLDDAGAAAAVPPVLRPVKADRRRLLGHGRRGGRATARRRHHAPARPQDWKSGDRLWVVEVIAPFGGAEAMVQDLKAKVFPQREMKFLTVGAQRREVRVL